MDPDSSEATKKKTPVIKRVSREELHDQLSASTTPSRLFSVMVALSTVVAAVGMMRDSVAVIIGAMVIAPLLGPNMALAFGTTVGDKKLIRSALACNAVGITIAMGMSTTAGLILPVDTSVPELASRADVHVADVALALASGAAGALAFTAGTSATLVGVMVAVALLPPTAAAGLMLGSGQMQGFLGAGTLLLVNIVSVNLAATLTFILQGVQPDTWWTEKSTQSTVRRSILIWGSLLALLVALLVMSA
ncbi:MAG: TIGR00341 family protein [Planctomycetota bacterium]